MSEAYEAVVFRATETATRALWAGLSSPWPFALLYLTPGNWGLCRVASRAEPFDATQLELVAAQVSRAVGAAVALSYDNASGLRTAAIFRAAALEERISEADELWSPLDAEGHPMQQGPRLRARELDPTAEYDCVASAIDIALSKIEIKDITAALLKQAFCYGEARSVAWQREAAVSKGHGAAEQGDEADER